VIEYWIGFTVFYAAKTLAWAFVITATVVIIHGVLYIDYEVGDNDRGMNR